MRIFIGLIFLFSFHLLCGQQYDLRGTIKDADSQVGLPGATIRVKSSITGTVTDIDGQFKLKVLESDTLVISFVGYTTLEEPIRGQKTLKLSLLTEKETLGEVVVTALGISRKEKSLGYSIGKMDVQAATTIRDPNLVNSMQGKIAGVEITKTSGGPGSSSRILIRGNSSVTNNNQPLVVVDGIPIDNTTLGTGGTWGGIDYGSPISDINPDDIESLVVLKGPSAAALYGSRALNGVIVITTKSGGQESGWQFSVNSSSSVESAYILKEFQDVYGAGTNGEFKYGLDSIPYFETDRPSTPTYASSWGPEMLDQTYRDWDSSLTTFSPQEDNYKDYFQTGTTFTNSFSAQRGGKHPLRISFTDLRNRGISPTSNFKRNNLNFSNNGPISKKLSYRFKLTLAEQRAYNRVNQSNGHNAARNIIMMPRSVSTESLERYEDEQQNEQTWYQDWGWIGNPYFTLYRNINYDDRQRALGNFSLVHKTNGWLSVMGRIGMDRFDESRHNRIASRSFTSPNGEFNDQEIDFFEVNADYLVTIQKELSDKWAFDANVGGNTMYQKRTVRSITGNNLITHGLYTFDNAPEANRSDRTQYWEQRMNSAYGSAQFGYNNFLFFEITGRNDWTSTLPAENNSYFYPSVSMSYVLTDHISTPKKLTFARFRVSAAEVGKDSEPYLLDINYDSLQTINGIQLWGIHNPFPLVNLEPEKKRSYELGTDLRFFNNRVGVDLTYYVESTVNQIFFSSVSPASGYSSAIVNSGEIQNRGIELLLRTVPIKKDKFTWTNTINWTQNRNKVVSLNSNGQREVLADQWRINVVATPGKPYGTIYGYGIQRSTGGTPLINADGTFIRTEEQIELGNINPDWKMGITNQLEYKQWSMSCLVDIQQGGDIYSATNMYMHGYSGNALATLEGRSEWYASEEAREDAGVAANGPGGGNDYELNWQATGGYQVEGVYAPGTTINGEDVSGQADTRYIDPQVYWSQHAVWTNEIHEPFVYDASFVKLRELGISYRFERDFLKSKLRDVSVTVSGRNLWLIHSNIPNVDPEATYTNGNGQGVEYASYPVLRSIGLNLKANF